MPTQEHLASPIDQDARPRSLSSSAILPPPETFAFTPSPLCESGIEQVAYCSVAHSLKAASSLSALVEQSQRSNSEHGITGLLMVEGALVIQWIEGPSSAVQRLWHSIQQDSRHHSIVPLVHRQHMRQRACTGWSMRRVSRNDMLAIVREAKEMAADANHPFAHAISTLSIVLDPELSQIYAQAARS